MNERPEIAERAAEGLRRFTAQRDESPVMLGFDGFVDSIIAVVDKRHDVKRYDAVPTIEQFGRKISAAAGKSSNYELVVKLQKLGGNGPIMANALASIGLPVTYIGALGQPTIHPVFEELAGRAECYSIAEPGETDALEFDDGKLMLGKYEHLSAVNWSCLAEAIGLDRLAGTVSQARLIGMVNWTMLPGMNEIYSGMVNDIFPRLTAGREERPIVFVDLADPEKRTAAALSEALELIAAMQGYVNVALGMNLKEATQVAAALDVDTTDDPESAIESISENVREKLDIHCVVVHPLKAAAGAMQVDGEVRTAWLESPYTRRPKLSTGAGDNFNAGFCLGLLAGMPIEQALAVGNATSGYYVREAQSPTLEQAAAFCEHMPGPEA
jgi:sugar/nucleoside kinase (ribokinase family)